MKTTSGKKTPPSSSVKSLVGIVLIVVALPSLYLGISQSGVLGYSLIVFSIMALVAALGIGYSFLIKPKEESIEPKTEPESMHGASPSSSYETLSLSSDVESLAIFDSDYLLDTMDGDRDMVTMLLEVFVEEHFDDGHKIVKALQAGDLDQVQMLSHSLKGVSASLGAEQIYALAEQVEHEVKMPAGNEKLENLCELLKMVFTPAALEIQAFLDESAKLKSQQANRTAVSVPETPVPEQLVQNTTVQDPPIQGNLAQDVTSQERAESGVEPDGWLDVNALREAMDGDEEAVCMLLEIFIDDNIGKGQVLVAAVTEAGQQDHALNVVHALKGVAANLSARPLRGCCAVAETKFKQNEPVSVEECREIERVLNQTIASAEAYLAETSVGA